MPEFVWFSSMSSIPRLSPKMVRFLMAVLRRFRRICIDTKVLSYQETPERSGMFSQVISLLDREHV